MRNRRFGGMLITVSIFFLERVVILLLWLYIDEINANNLGGFSVISTSLELLLSTNLCGGVFAMSCQLVSMICKAGLTRPCLSPIFLCLFRGQEFEARRNLVLFGPCVAAPSWPRGIAYGKYPCDPFLANMAVSLEK